MNKPIVRMKVHAGGGWEGHVVFTAINPKNQEDSILSSNMSEVIQFCEKRDLDLDLEFGELIKKFLCFEAGTGLVIPPIDIDEQKPITSASHYLKKNFSNYY